MNIFFMFEEEYERNDVESIWDIKLPIEKIKAYLEEHCSVSYRSNLWLYTQLKRYEEELGVKLFQKDEEDCAKGKFFLSINNRMLKFYQKQHLYVSKKIKVANAIYDKIANDLIIKEKDQVKILLGAGSTIFHLADILAEKSWQDPVKYMIYTHNLGSLKRLLEPTVNYKTIEVFTPEGKVDSVTYTIIGDSYSLYNKIDFDYIIMGTSYIYNENLYVESSIESRIKGTILKETRGSKILILTKHEFTDHPPRGLASYGSIKDYDYIVVPRINTKSGQKKKYDLIFEEYTKLFEPEIIHWNYTILKSHYQGDA